MEAGQPVVPEVGAFLLGSPKAGTTWLADALSQHPDICVSDPKEPNIVATHKGTFSRDASPPNWEAYADCFVEKGVRIDCSVHALACPIAPQRVRENWPGAKLIISLREPVSRTISHWNMAISTEEDKENNLDWSDFEVAWSDSRLQCDTLYGSAISRWLEFFDLDSILIIEAKRMREEPAIVLKKICEHIGVDDYSFRLDLVRNTNTASDRRPLTLFGRLFRSLANLLPDFVKRPVVKRLQKKGVNIYKMPVLSGKALEKRKITDEQRSILAETVNEDLLLLEELTGFSNPDWWIQS
ncbi:MAG: hypothetical protein CMA61_03485 [Euryarchaeota archaeon]|jgi:hypothetical protein|nr:hypothetical protein [Euryarchaeota archaeon]|tara:strand:- start:4540 stop:5433 length:894 start_codon:yes stop_codon:yes gene_type:complete